MPLPVIFFWIAAALAGGAVLAVVLWNKYRDKIREWNISKNLSSSLLSRAVVRLDRYVTRIRAKVKVRRNNRSYDEDVYEEILSDEQIDALKRERPEIFSTLLDNKPVEVDVLSSI